MKCYSWEKIFDLVGVLEFLRALHISLYFSQNQQASLQHLMFLQSTNSFYNGDRKLNHILIEPNQISKFNTHSIDISSS